MGDSFRGQLDPVKGFLISQDEQLNRLAGQRLFVTWFNNEPNYDLGRGRQEVFSLSTLPQKYLPWRPVSIDPTILNENSGPLRFIHQVVSDTHFDDPLRLVNIPSRSFSDFERQALASYFEISLMNSDMEVFGGWLDTALEWWQVNREAVIQTDRYFRELYSDNETLEQVNEYMEKILAILVNFSSYQYNLSYNDDYSIDVLKEFLLNTKDGDCVEFSNTLALLGRLAGIPSRVVTGYLAAEELQTSAHLRGLAALRERIPVLQDFPFDNLFMVTNLHAHSWTQFYIPEYGWLDFEATSFALPPVGGGDFNTWDVVIPLINENRVFSPVRQFPWRAVLRAAGILAVFALILAYILRYVREAVLYFGAQRGGRTGARCLYLLLLARLAADGKPIKPASKTALEYAELFPGMSGDSHLLAFASLYSELRWREFGDRAEIDNRFRLLEREYRDILAATQRKGILKRLIRIFSLRGLAYL
uniref:Transglutaminase-like enzyme n=1 Tax=uncultured bacterium contig00076 TaxID=1181554 RepID=A0A806KGJ4_9BACT|nr:transglutaminase-like enzyme [uncultured bacterium contig00076]